MEQREKRNNLRLLFGMEKISGTDQIRNVLDGIEPGGLHGVFDKAREVGRNREGETHTLYYHEMVVAAVVKPGKPEVVLPLIPEFIRNEDGKEKQDGERNAAKRWIKQAMERMKQGKRIYAAYLPEGQSRNNTA
ncbi:MAG: hypothetical protein LBK43_10055 [Treponema sp.]|nr:hypothetical protein [Treponema sp.]